MAWIFRLRYEIKIYVQSLAVGYPNMASRSLAVIRYDPTHSALHSSNVVARLPNKPVQVCPGRCHVVVGSPVKGIIGRLVISKLYFPGDSSDSNLKVPRPKSSWMVILICHAGNLWLSNVSSSDSCTKDVSGGLLIFLSVADLEIFESICLANIVELCTKWVSC